MKISGNYLKKPVNYNKTKETKKSNTSSSSNNVRKDTVEINFSAKTVGNTQTSSILDVKNKIVEDINKDTPIERLDGIKADIQNNNYEVTSKKIAGALLDY